MGCSWKLWILHADSALTPGAACPSQPQLSKASVPGSLLPPSQPPLLSGLLYLILFCVWCNTGCVVLCLQSWHKIQAPSMTSGSQASSMRQIFVIQKQSVRQNFINTPDAMHQMFVSIQYTVTHHCSAKRASFPC